MSKEDAGELMSESRIWTTKLQQQWSPVYKHFIPGVRVIPVHGRYSGDPDRLNKSATILDVEIRKLNSGHVALGMGYTHEELYKVRYEDGVENVLWPDECIERSGSNEQK